MEIVFQHHPDVTIGGNTFVRVPTILQYEDMPLLEVGKFVAAGFTTRFPVYHSDGTKIAVVDGSQIYVTNEGKKASLVPKHEPNLTAFIFEGQPILELRRDRAAALKGWAELYAPGGVLLKVHDDGVRGLLGNGESLQVGGMSLSGCSVVDCAIGIHVRNGMVGIGTGKQTIITPEQSKARRRFFNG